MPPAAAIPLIAAGIGAGGSIAAASIASGSGTTKAPPPVAVFPGAQQNYLEQLGVTGKDGLGPNSLGTLNEIGTTGTLAAAGKSAAPAWAALVDAQKRTIAEGTGNILEQFGSSGLRYSSDLMNKLVDFNAQTSKDMTGLFAQLQQQGTQNALGAANIGAGLFSDVATAMTPSAFVTTGGGPASTALGGASNLLQTLAMMKILFPTSGGGSTPSSPGTQVSNLPGAISTDVPNTPPAWLQFLNPTNFGPATANA